ncbi:MAG: hypothetical protein KF788_06085 [Piscinibacter sp.]|nr:hypothetical protein [Piscinibacter sp.]
MKLRAWMLVAPLVAALSACGGGGGDSQPDNTPFDPFAHPWESICQDNGSTGFKYYARFDAAAGTFTVNSASGFRTSNCQGANGRAGVNTLFGNFVVRNQVTTADGYQAAQVDFSYNQFTQSARTSVTPSDFDLVYVDPVTHVIYLGQKSAARPGTSAGTRPDRIDFNAAWTPF